MRKVFTIILIFFLILLFPKKSILKYGTKSKIKLSKYQNNNVTVDTRKLLGEKFKKTIPLFNARDELTYHYFEFLDGGYMIVHNATGEIAERASIGEILFKSDKNYYFGPYNCFSRVGELFYNVIYDEIIEGFDENLLKISDDIDKLFEEELKKINDSKNDKKKNKRLAGDSSNSSISYGLDFDLNYATLISNYNFFLSNPRIAVNYVSQPTYYGNTGICGPVAVQLLLNYLNYYQDRRIIPNYFLNGGVDGNGNIINVNENPNSISDPDAMNSLVLGSSSDLDNSNSLINYLCSLMMSPGSSSTSHADLVYGIRDYLCNYIGSDGFLINDFRDILNVLDLSNLVKNEIDNDSPAIIGLRTGALSGHYTIAYGYTSPNVPDTTYSYTGFVMHNGYYVEESEFSSEKWVNSIYCDEYISVTISHTHNYDNYVQNPYSVQYEYQCSECGHRTRGVMIINDTMPNNRLSKINMVLNGRINRIQSLYIQFKLSSAKFFQTIGQKDLKITLRESNNNLVKMDDDDGFELNSFFNVNVISEKWYKIQVILNDYVDRDYSALPINVLLIISYSNKDNTSEFSQLRFLNDADTQYLQRKEALYYRFVPDETRNYTFKTKNLDNFIVDTYMYIFSLSNFSPTNVFEDDDSGGNMQSSITANLYCDEEYLIIVMAYNPNTINGVVTISLDNQRSKLPDNICQNRAMGRVVNLHSESGIFFDKYGNNAYKVTDASLTNSNQPRIIVDLVSAGVNLPTLQYSTYKSVILCIQLSLYEISDGYKDIYLKDQFGNDYATSLCFEYGSNYIERNYETFLFYIEIPKNRITSTYLEINFTAHGNGNDDWVFINPVMIAGYSNDVCCSNSIRYFTGLSVLDF